DHELAAAGRGGESPGRRARGPGRRVQPSALSRYPARMPAESFVDLERYPLFDLDSACGREVVREGHEDRARRGMAGLPGLLRAETIEPLRAECESLAKLGHFSEVQGTPYIEVPPSDLPDDHPRRTLQRTALTAVAYDLFPTDSALRALYESDVLMDF